MENVSRECNGEYQQQNMVEYIDSINVSGIQRFNRYYGCDRLNDLIDGTGNVSTN